MVLKPRTQQNLPNTFEIKHVLECKRCAESCPAGTSLSDWTRVVVGLTSYGLQVWCARHNANIMHVDFRNQRLGVNATAARDIIWPNSP